MVGNNGFTPATKETVQGFERRDHVGGMSWWGDSFYRIPYLPTWGTRSRDRRLRLVYRDPYNTLVQGAFAGLIKRWASTPYQIEGGKRNVKNYQELLNNAQFGEYGGNWRGFISRLGIDFLSLDFGGVVEIIGGGASDRPLKGRVVGIAQLDALRCEATGNPEYPLVYWSRITGQLHKLHYTRVYRFVDMPDGDEAFYGLGLCALSRSIAIAQQQILMTQYNVQKLDDLPPAGLMLLNNIGKGEWDDARKLYQADRQRDGGTIWANTMVLRGTDPNNAISANILPFSQTPDQFSYRDMMEIHVNALALAIGVDPQDIWPLTGAPMGTGTQSAILHTKAQGKMFADMLTMLERFINFYILPDDMEFSFKFTDTESDKEQAEITAMQMTIASELARLTNTETALRYLADNVESMRDVLLDPTGEMIEVDDNDPKADTQLESEDQEITADDTTPNASTNAQPTTADDTSALEAARAVAGIQWNRTAEVSRGTVKTLQATRLDFEGDFEDLLASAQADDTSRRRFGTVLRALIAKYGKRAYQDGLVEGGIEDDLTDGDLSAIGSLVSDQTGYVTDFANKVYSADGLSELLAEQKPEQWFNKSINPFYLEGLQSADENGLYEWVYGDTEHCADCKRLDGQKHRLKDWIKSGWKPKADKLACKGFKCKCSYVKTKGRTSGSY